MEPPPPTNTAWTYYGSITGQAWQRGGMQGAWSAIRDQQQLQGLPNPTFADVTQLYSFAASQRRAADALANAPDSESNLTPMITTVAGSRPLEQRNAVPRFGLRYETETPEELGGGTQWFERSIGGSLPASAGDIREDISNAIELEGEGSEPEGSTWTGNAILVAY